MCILYPVFGFGFAYALSRPGFPLRRFWEALITLPLVFPPVAIGFFLLMLLGRGNILGSTLYQQFGFELVFSVWGVLLAAFISGLSLVVKPILSAIESGTEDLMEASYTLGRGKLYTIFHILIPGVRRSIISGVTLGVGRSLGEVGITLMLGGNIAGKTETLSLAIYNSVLDGNFSYAMKVSALLGSASIIIFIISRVAGE
jgi:molybdate transport system permease protein